MVASVILTFDKVVCVKGGVFNNDGNKSPSHLLLAFLNKRRRTRGRHNNAHAPFSNAADAGVKLPYVMSGILFTAWTSSCHLSSVRIRMSLANPDDKEWADAGSLLVSARHPYR